jgi:hypothetical protein
MAVNLFKVNFKRKNTIIITLEEIWGGSNFLILKPLNLNHCLEVGIKFD